LSEKWLTIESVSALVVLIEESLESERFTFATELTTAWCQ